ncbi:GntR family transcriptional regulator [Asticcacaulis sp. BYS171W]|uniref:GntR family transcriptional regulator n=1 Tax=Asticcacaulis aquaticus TaxID=2984212 RepID=A0ABT5HTP8_9CAUL|nr:GntR family transcriptional regulator [Asticcacaulis aquaticus]MDC7683442.1 GntR family transcriptional regulator [Asticcacaulis aquaticus]
MAIIVQTLSEQIFTLVRDQIISGKIPINESIRQDALAAELGVSKIPLREALARLEQDGLLLNLKNRGYFVRPLNSDEVEEIYALRLKIEPDAVAQASLVATDADRRVAKDALLALDAAAHSDKGEVGKLNRAFHMALVRPLNRQVTIQIIERLHIISERYVGKHLEPAGRDDRAHKEHTEMYEVWAAGKAQQASAMMHDHIASTLYDLRAQFADQG